MELQATVFNKIKQTLKETAIACSFSKTEARLLKEDGLKVAYGQLGEGEEMGNDQNG